MARASLLQNAFNGGELSPRLFGRTDISKYALSLASLQNAICLTSGPVARRSGFRFVAEVKDSSIKSRLIPFVFSDDQAYVFELSNQILRVFTLEGILLPNQSYDFVDADVDTTADTIRETNFTWPDEDGPYRLTTTGTLPAGLALGTDYYIKRLATTNDEYNDEFQLSLTPGGAAVNITGAAGGGTHTITRVTAATALEIDTPYLEAQLFDIQFAQSADVLYLAHPLHEPAKISRLAAAKWRLEDIDFFDGPYDPINTTSTTMTPNLVAATTITASADTFLAGRDEGRLIRINHVSGADDQWGYARIDSVSSATLVSVTTLRNFALATASASWRLGHYYTGQFPRSVTFHEQRLVFAGTDGSPQRFDGSVIGDFENFAPSGGPLRSGAAADFDQTISADNAYAFTISSNQVNVISWLNAIRNLLVGTVGGIWPVQATSNLDVVAPDNINVRRSSSRGAASVVPVNVEDATIYVSRSKRRIFEVAYSFDADAFIPNDLTLLADHLTDIPVVELDYAQDIDSIVWAVREDGVLLGMTINRQQQVSGWHRHLPGNSFGTVTAVDQGANTMTITGHSFSTQEQVRIDRNAHGLVKDKDYFVRSVDANTIAFYNAASDANADTNRIDLTTAPVGLPIVNAIAIVESIAVIPAPDGVVTPNAHENEKHDQLWAIVKRWINGNEKRYVEFLEDRFPDTADIDDAFFVDSGLTLVPLLDVVSGLDHLEGEEVQVLADGAVHPERTVSGGSITLNRTTYMKVQVGLRYESIAKTLTPEGAGSQTGSSHTKRKRVDHVETRFYRSNGVEIARTMDELQWDPVLFRSASDLMNNPVPLFSGTNVKSVGTGWDEESQIALRQVLPLPMMLLALGKRMQSSER